MRKAETTPKKLLLLPLIPVLALGIVAVANAISTPDTTMNPGPNGTWTYESDDCLNCVMAA